MKPALAALFCLLFAIPALSDETPKKPHRLFDRKLIFAGLTMLAGEIADNESTIALLNRNSHAHEANPFYGRHPSRLRMYSLGSVLTGLSFLSAVAARQQALRQGRPGSKAWIMPVVIHNSIRGFAAWHNSTIPASHPHFLRVCPAAGAGCN